MTSTWGGPVKSLSWYWGVFFYFLWCVTCHIWAALSVERTLSQNDLMSDYSETVHVSFLRDPQHAQVFRSGPQVCQADTNRDVLKILDSTTLLIYLSIGYYRMKYTKSKKDRPFCGVRIVLQPKSVIFTTMRLSTTQLVDLSLPCISILLECR